MASPEDAARLDALLAIMASLDDTCLLHRAGLAGLHAGTARRAPGAANWAAVRLRPGRTALAELDRTLLSLNASPGGAADLLAATLFHRYAGASRHRRELSLMEHLTFDYPAQRAVTTRAHVGVVGSGDLEVLLSPASTQ